MSNIIIRFANALSYVEVFEIKNVDPNISVATLKSMVEDRLIADESCMMRVFCKWYLVTIVQGKERPVELTEEDDGMTLAALGMEDYSKVLLEGPITGDHEGVGQALALISAKMRHQNSKVERLLQNILDIQNYIVSISFIPQSEDAARRELQAEEQRAFTRDIVPQMEFAERQIVFSEERLEFEIFMAESSYLFLALVRDTAKELGYSDDALRILMGDLPDEVKEVECASSRHRVRLLSMELGEVKASIDKKVEAAKSGKVGIIYAKPADPFLALVRDTARELGYSDDALRILMGDLPDEVKEVECASSRHRVRLLSIELGEVKASIDKKVAATKGV